MAEEAPVQPGNRFLTSLSAADFTRLGRSIGRISLECGQLLNQPGEPIGEIKSERRHRADHAFATTFWRLPDQIAHELRTRLSMTAE